MARCRVSTLDHYTPDQLRQGVSDLMYFLANPRLDLVIWRVQEDMIDSRQDRSEPRKDSTIDFRSRK